MKDFLVSFNVELEKTNRYCNLQYFDDGFVKGISIPEIHLFDDDNDNIDYVEELSLSRLVKTLNELLSVAETELSIKIDSFFDEKLRDLKEKFPKLKIKFNFLSITEYYIFVSGEYDEEELLKSLDVVKEDFEYVFEGCKLDTDI